MLLFSITTLAFAWMVFVIVILLLSMMLIQARKKLVPQGNVSIVVNGDTENPLLVQPGSSLLTVLSGENIFLPSACGGGGTCGGGKFTDSVRIFFGKLAISQVPIDRSSQAVFKFGVCMPTEFTLCTARIYTSARLSIGA